MSDESRGPSTVAMALKDLTPEARGDVERARRGESWDTALLAQIVSRWYELPADVLSAAVHPNGIFGHEGETLAVVLLAPDHDKERNARACYDEGVVAANAGDFALALSLFSRAVADNPIEPDYRRNLGQARLQIGDLDGATRDLHAALRLRPDDVPTLTVLGNIAIYQRKPADALQYLRRSIAVAPNVQAYSSLGAALASLGQMKDAESAFRAALALDPSYPPAEAGLRLISASH